MIIHRQYLFIFIHKNAWTGRTPLSLIFTAIRVDGKRRKKSEKWREQKEKPLTRLLIFVFIALKCDFQQSLPHCKEWNIRLMLDVIWFAGANRYIFRLSEKWYYIRIQNCTKLNITRRKPNITASQLNSPQANITEKSVFCQKQKTLFSWRAVGDSNPRPTGS